MISDLPLGEIAMSMGLLKMPLMPELKGRKITGFVAPAAKKDLNSIKYTDKKKETSRQEKLTTYKQTGSWPGKAGEGKKLAASERTQAWSQKVDKKAKKVERRKKKDLKTAGEKRKAQMAEKDEDELEEDFRLLKRLKKGKASMKDFDENVAELDNIVDDE